MKRVTVIIPIYNTEKYLRKCIESIINQTYQELEIILIDDGSIDSSYSICAEYASRDKRIVLIRKDNEGQAVARNYALNITQGEYICFVDSDDYADSNMIMHMIELAELNKADIVQCMAIKVTETGEKDSIPNLKRRFFDRIDAMRCYLCETNSVLQGAPWAKLFRKEVFDDIRFPVVRMNEDTWMMFKVIDKCKYIVFDPTIVYYSLERQGSTSRSTFNMNRINIMMDCFNDVQKMFEDKPEYSSLIRYVKSGKVDTILWIAYYVYLTNDPNLSSIIKNLFDVSKKIKLEVEYKSFRQKMMFNTFLIFPKTYLRVYHLLIKILNKRT